MIDPGLENKTVLITGANHGIGAATATAFATQGARVFITFYRERTELSDREIEDAIRSDLGGYKHYTALQQQDAEHVLKSIRDKGGKAVACETNLAEAAHIPLLFDLCEEKIGPVDILVNNHAYCVLETFDPGRLTDGGDGLGQGFPIHLPRADIIDSHFTINTRAYALMMSEYFQRNIEKGANWGRVINLSTDAAHQHEGNISYAASKHAIESYSRSAAAEMGKYGITVNIVAPGPIQTGYIPPNMEEKIARATPLGRVGKPEDVAEVILFLASEQAHWLTGQLLYVGGGWRMDH